MNLEELETSWGTLETPESPDGLSSRRATGVPRGQPVYVAVDGRDHRHLLIQVPDNSAPIIQPRTRWLEVTSARYRLGADPEALYVDLVCMDPAQNPTFGAVAEDMLRVLVRPHGRPRDVIFGALARWRTFWSAVAEGMGREKALKLFAELLFMKRWLAPVTPQVMERWTVGDEAQYDFQWSEVAVEVKGAEEGRANEEPQYLVTSLEPMDDPEHGRLFLFSLQVREDAVAADSLHSLVQGPGGRVQRSPGPGNPSRPVVCWQA